MSRTIKAQVGPRRVGVTQARRELYATGRMVDSAAAQVLMLGEDDFVSDTEHDELEGIGQELRGIAERIHARVDDL